MNAISDIQAGKGLTRALAEQARTLRLHDIPEPIRQWARQCVLDYLGCGIAGASDELVTILLAEMREQGGNEIASVLGHAARLPAASAAIVNGAASHALDFDDVNLAMPGHPSVAILPALLAMAEERGSSGAEVLTAFVAGYELQCRIGRTIAPVITMGWDSMPPPRSAVSAPPPRARICSAWTRNGSRPRWGSPEPRRPG